LSALGPEIYSDPNSPLILPISHVLLVWIERSVLDSHDMQENNKVAFRAIPNARSNAKAGTLYAVKGERRWIYYGQCAPDGSVGFFRFRTRRLASAAEVLAHPVMTRVCMLRNASGGALRAGAWHKMGGQPLHRELAADQLYANWPVASLTIDVWKGGDELYQASIDDPRVQDLEIMAVWDWTHMPPRLTADFGVEPARWDIGGLVWRERLVKEEMARRFPDQPWHELPPDWVPVSRQ